MNKKVVMLLVLLLVVGGIVYYVLAQQAQPLILTGIVTTDDVMVSSEIQGRLQTLTVDQGDAVTNGQLLAVIQPAEQEANLAYFAGGVAQTGAQVTQAEADLRYQESQTSNLVAQSQASLAAAKAQVTQAEADLENLSLDFKREQTLRQQGVDSAKEFDQARTAFQAGQARVDSLRKQASAAESAVALAQSTGEQIPARRAAVEAYKHELAAAGAQKDKAEVILGYTHIVSPTNAIVDVRAARPGEVVNPGQAIVTLINPKDLWVRADVEESYIEKVPLGKKLKIRLPSGDTKEGTVFYRGVDADYATQRDVSRTKRDIKTFQIRLRCDNDDSKLAVGMTASVVLDLKAP